MFYSFAIQLLTTTNMDGSVPIMTDFAGPAWFPMNWAMAKDGWLVWGIVQNMGFFSVWELLYTYINIYNYIIYIYIYTYVCAYIYIYIYII